MITRQVVTRRDWPLRCPRSIAYLVATVTAALVKPGIASGADTALVVIDVHQLPVPLASASSSSTPRVFLESAPGDQVFEAAPLTGAKLPKGRWYWQAESGSSVTVGANSVDIESGSRSLQLEGQWVQACRVTFADPDRWKAVQRLEVASRSHRSLYVVSPRERRSFLIPAGENVGVAFAGGGPVGVFDLRCRSVEPIALSFPSPPARDQNVLLVRLHAPEVDETRLEATKVALSSIRRASREMPAAPEVLLWRGRFAWALFRWTRREYPLSLVVRSDLLRSLRAPVEDEPGLVREMGSVELRSRFEIHAEIVYAPAGHHKMAMVGLRRCGDAPSEASPVLDAFERGRCSWLSESKRPLVEGHGSYSFQNLDSGQYVLNAVVDGQEVYGLGHWLSFYLDQDADDAPALGPVLLKEFELFGLVLDGGESVQAAVRLFEVSFGAQAPTRTAHTGPDGMYHLRYFGQSPAYDSWLRDFPTDVQNRDKDRDLLGLYWGAQLSVCSDDGRCRAYHQASKFIGGGRLDLSLGTDVTVTVHVVEASDGQAVPGAWVSLASPMPRLLFVDGSASSTVTWEHSGTVFVADENGVVSLRGLEPGHNLLIAERNGDAATVRKPFEVVEGEPAVDIQLELPPEEEPTTSAKFFEGGSGERLGRGSILVFHQDGTAACLLSLVNGVATRDPSSCGDLSNARYVVVAPGVSIEDRDASELTTPVEIQLAPSPPSAVHLRVVDHHGRPVSGVQLGLSFGDLEIEPVVLSAANSELSGGFLPATDSDGETILSGVGGEEASAPRLIVRAQDGKSRRIAIYSLDIVDGARVVVLP